MGLCGAGPRYMRICVFCVCYYARSTSNLEVHCNKHRFSIIMLFISYSHDVPPLPYRMPRLLALRRSRKNGRFIGLNKAVTKDLHRQDENQTEIKDILNWIPYLSLSLHSNRSNGHISLPLPRNDVHLNNSCHVLKCKSYVQEEAFSKHPWNILAM